MVSYGPPGLGQECAWRFLGTILHVVMKTLRLNGTCIEIYDTGVDGLPPVIRRIKWTHQR